MTNEEVCARAPGCSAAFIEARLGIHQRRIAAPDEQTSDLAVKAATHALEMARLPADALDGIICSVGTGDVPVPATACFIQEKLGLAGERAKKPFAFDVKMACAGAVGGTMLARGLVESGMAEHVLVVGTQIISRTTLDWSDRATAPIFGDGAGAMIVGRSPDGARGFLGSRLCSDGELTGIVGQSVGGTREYYTPEALRDGRAKLHMDGRAVWDCAVRELPRVVRAVVEGAGFSLADVDYVVPHQANRRLVERVLDDLGIEHDRAWFNVEKYGNTVAASAFVALDEANRAGRLEPGKLGVLMAIGAGMTWGAHLIRW
jgi:3-oxoacyl-[acyl-carrier-protein] synthase-3